VVTLHYSKYDIWCLIHEVRMHTLNVNYLMKVRNIKCKLKYEISTMVICGSYICEFCVSKDMKKIK